MTMDRPRCPGAARYQKPAATRAHVKAGIKIEFCAAVSRNAALKKEWIAQSAKHYRPQIDL
jgi:hypothetical protein